MDCGEHLNGKVQNTFGCGSFFGVWMALGYTFSSYDGAFHKVTKSGLNSNMVIGT